MEMCGWGRYPIIKDATVLQPENEARLVQLICNSNPAEQFNGIARGLGRSYGDSSLSSQMLRTAHLDRFTSFDESTGLLTCECGVSLEEICRVFTPRGWFLSVVPGTRFVSVGGAIASDVHGKNHHHHGTFCDHLESLKLVIPSGEVICCSKTENTDIFLATCGGMGLTGVILSATFRLLPIASPFIDQTSVKTANLEELFQKLDQHDKSTYSVAWLDCMATGDELGKSILYLGEHETKAELEPSRRGNIKLSVPINMPRFMLNKYTIGAFNTLYYKLSALRIKSTERQRIYYDKFFFPLDNIRNWNRLYGRKGFVQYQFVVPTQSGYEAVKAVLEEINKIGKGSFLSVLKKFGGANENYLSFPMQGYTLALDFKYEENLLPLLDRLDDMVIDFGGRVYLAKDSRMSESTFKKSYPQWQMFSELRAQLGATNKFNSMQSQRLGL